MLITFRTNDGKNVCIAWGEVWTEPYTKKPKTKRVTITSFYLKYDTTKENGKTQAQTLFVCTWGKISGQAQLLHKHQDVIIFGKIEREDFMSIQKKKDIFKLTGEMIIPVSAVWQSLKEQMAKEVGYPTAEKYTNFSAEGIPELNSFDEMLD